MKKFYILILMVLTTGIAFSKTPALIQEIDFSMQIDSLDSVVFDMSNYEIIGSKMRFPISIQSNDTINALDFEFKYNMDSLLFDSIVELTTYIQPFSYFNVNDSTFRYTSYSLQAYDLNMPLMKVQFLNLLPQMAVNTVSNVRAYLNGSECPVKIILPLVSGIDSYENNDKSVLIYPNPASGYLIVNSEKTFNIQVISLSSGETLSVPKTNLSNGITTINLENLPVGAYFLKLTNSNGISTFKKFIKVNP